MRSVLLRLGVFVVFAAMLLSVMYLAVQNRQSEPEVILYDQYDNVSTAGWGAFNDIFNGERDGSEQVADDFVVPEGQTWTISRVEVAGIYVYNFRQSKAQSIHVDIYQDTDSLPGADIAAQPSLSYTVFPTDSAEVQEIPVPPIPSPGADTTHGSLLVPISPVTLPPGVYWLSVRADIHISQEEPLYNWLWQWRTIIANHPSVHRQYFGPAFYGIYADIEANKGWSNWERSINYRYDLVFRLRGYLHSTVPRPTETDTIPLPTETPTNTPTPSEPTRTASPIVPSITATPPNMPTDTPEIVPTSTATSTSTSASTFTSTHTSVPTSQPSVTATATPTAESTSTPTTTATGTSSATIAPSITVTSTATTTPTIEPTATPIVQHKGELTPVRPSVTATVTATATQSVPHKPPPLAKGSPNG
jgi:hypothetical protein